MITLEQLSAEYPEKYALIKEVQDMGVKVFEVSTLTKQGVMDVKATACDEQLVERVEGKLRGKKVEGILNR